VRLDVTRAQVPEEAANRIALSAFAQALPEEAER